MDENQIGPNMNTTPVQRYVRDGPYPSGKAVPCNLKVLGDVAFPPTCGPHLFSFCPPLFGDPRECRGDVAFPPTCGPHLF